MKFFREISPKFLANLAIWMRWVKHNYWSELNHIRHKRDCKSLPKKKGACNDRCSTEFYEYSTLYNYFKVCQKARRQQVVWIKNGVNSFVPLFVSWKATGSLETLCLKLIFQEFRLLPLLTGQTCIAMMSGPSLTSVAGHAKPRNLIANLKATSTNIKITISPFFQSWKGTLDKEFWHIQLRKQAELLASGYT